MPRCNTKQPRPNSPGYCRTPQHNTRPAPRSILSATPQSRRRCARDPQRKTPVAAPKSAPRPQPSERTAPQTPQPLPPAPPAHRPFGVSRQWCRADATVYSDGVGPTASHARRRGPARRRRSPRRRPAPPAPAPAGVAYAGLRRASASRAHCVRFAPAVPLPPPPPQFSRRFGTTITPLSAGHGADFREVRSAPPRRGPCPGADSGHPNLDTRRRADPRSPLGLPDVG